MVCIPLESQEGARLDLHNRWPHAARGGCPSGSLLGSCTCQKLHCLPIAGLQSPHDKASFAMEVHCFAREIARKERAKVWVSVDGPLCAQAQANKNQ